MKGVQVDPTVNGAEGTGVVTRPCPRHRQTLEGRAGLDAKRLGDSPGPVLELGGVTHREAFQEVPPIKVGCPLEMRDAGVADISPVMIVVARRLDFGGEGPDVTRRVVDKGHSDPVGGDNRTERSSVLPFG